MDIRQMQFAFQRFTKIIQPIHSSINDCIRFWCHCIQSHAENKDPQIKYIQYYHLIGGTYLLHTTVYATGQNVPWISMRLIFDIHCDRSIHPYIRHTTLNPVSHQNPGRIEDVNPTPYGPQTHVWICTGCRRLQVKWVHRLHILNKS